MAEEPEKKEDKFEFTPEGEFVEYISLGDARVMAIRHARENTEIYGFEYQDTTMVWEPVSETEEEEFYDIRLSFRPSGTFTGRPGLEQFVISKTGDIELRQVLESPGSKSSGGMPKFLLFGGLGALVIAVIAVIVVIATSGGADAVPVETSAPAPQIAPQAAASGTAGTGGTQRNEFEAAIKSVTSSTTVGAVFISDTSQS